ncbi:MAG: MFS transporter, partial [Planctomycetota bacterium]
SFWVLTGAQFLGAFNDNFFKQFILVLALHLSKQQSITIPWWPDDPQAIAGAVFAVPFVLFALCAGYIADRFSRRTIVVAMKFVEIVVMALGLGALYYGTKDVNAGVMIAMGVLFLMGTQSAFFGPAKYGSIPEMVPEPRLSWANGIVQMTTMVAIILGTSIPLFQYQLDQDIPFYTAGYLFVAIAVVGWCLSLGIRGRPAADPTRRFSLRLFLVPTEVVGELRFAARDRELLLAIFGGAWFVLVGALALFAINSYGQNELGLADAGTRLFVFTAGGIALGSLLVGWISGPRVELGLVPIGIFGMGASFIALSLAPPSLGTARALLACAGLFGGFFVVPLQAFIQQRPAPEQKGRILGLMELTDFVFILASAGVYAVLANLLELNGPQLMLAIGIITWLGAVLLMTLSPTYMARLALWVLTHSVYRIKTVHPNRVPTHGGALLVSNHVSYVDPFLVGTSVPRFVRFLMHRGFDNVPLVGFFARLMKAIPISETDRPRELIKSLQEAAEHVKQGHVACIFAEGGISRTGNLLPFSKGLEHIAKRGGAPIIPMYLDRVWGSIFSFRGGRFFFKVPNILPYPVTVIFGEPLPPDASAHQVRQAIQLLAAEALDLRKRSGETLATRFLRVAARFPFRQAVTDHTGKVLSYFKLLVGVFVLRSLLRQRLGPDERHVGVLLPPSIGGTLVNVTLAVVNRISVNLNFTIGREAFDDAIRQCGIRTIITSRAFLEKIDMPFGDSYVDLAELLGRASAGTKFWAALKALLPSFILTRLPGVCRAPDADATVIFSSGSTGTPKGVCLTHHNILSNARSLEQVFDSNRHDCMVGVLPLFHSFGYTATLWFPLLSGFKAAFHPSPVDAAKIAETIRDHHGTFFVSTPTFYLSYLRRWKKEDVASLRITASGAEKLKSSLSEAWEKRFGQPILEGYGCTELSPAVAINVPDAIDPERDVHQIGHKPGTIGHPLPGIAVRVVDPDTHDERPPNEEGLLLVKGPNVMRGYLGRDDLTEAVIRNGWYVTGDIARIDDDGFITITDRQSRFSKIGGEMVPHVKVEEEIQGAIDRFHACQVGDHQQGACPEVAVTAIPDDRKGERLVVLHTPIALSVEELIAQLKDSLPNLWIPRRDSFVEVEQIPKLGSGKLDLRRVREAALAAVGGRDSGDATPSP